ncbi:hypothetical protein BH20ACI2_BH20ACI2_11100 [soil metagenome]
MKKLLFCICLALGLSVVGAGQTSKKSPNTKNEPEIKDAAHSSDSAMGSQSILSSGTSIEGQLQSSIDVKKARVGDEVILKTTKSITQNGQTVVPKGSKLIGRVTEVQQKTRSNGMSKLGMVFDRVEGKEISEPLSTSITSITNVASSTRLGDTASSDLFGSSSTSTQTSGGSSSGGGGLLGGVGSTVGGVTGTAGGLLNTTTQTVGGVTNTAGQRVGSSVGTLGWTVNGLQISNSVSGSAQSGTTLSAADKNIRLEKGVTFMLVTISSVQQQ